MSAYGEQPPRPAAPPLSSTTWALKDHGVLSVHHVPAAAVPDALAAALHALFAAELERGATYPQEGPMTRSAFAAYFLAHDVFVGVCGGGGDTLDGARADRLWDDCLGGAYYVKQNYPGRSGHICNAGFVVPPPLRGRGIASALARSFLHYAPRLGYQASVFNLVYVNNVASNRIWDNLGFEKIGRIPRAGRLRRAEEDGGGEEYVDAWIVYKNFEEEKAAVTGR